ncbi:MAG: hypothetical protein U9O41_09625, partial [Candidatus Aerophobetes bacterium]|nr:hypothetical protein [Candidatus Aerophobetes bacterium]
MSEEKTVSKIKKGLYLIFRFYKEYVCPYKGKFFIIWVLHVLFAGALIVPPFLIKQLIDEGIKNKDLHLIWILAISVAGIFVALALIDKIRNFWG